MSIRPIIMALLLACAGCSRGADADLQSIAQARSVAAEWAMVNQLDAQHRLNRTYVGSMRHWFADALDSAQASLRNPQSDYGAEIRTLARAAPETPSAVLRAHAARLKRIEDQLESA